jgi:hypothetical protein
MKRLTVVSATGAPYNVDPNTTKGWLEQRLCAIKNETGNWLPLDFDGRPVPPGPPPVPPRPPDSKGDCSSQLALLCNRTAYPTEKACVTCTLEAEQGPSPPDCDPAQRHAYCNATQA